MPFDGVHWGAPITGSALAAYPGGSVTADALFGSAVSGYYAARRNGRLFADVTFPRRERGAEEGAQGLWIDALSHTTLGGGRGWVDGTWTHATVFMLANVVAAVDSASVLRVVADDGTTTATGTGTEVAIVPNAGENGNWFGDAVEPGDVAPTYALHLQQAEVSLATLTLSARIRIRAQGYVTEGGFLKPYHIAIYLECRD